MPQLDTIPKKEHHCSWYPLLQIWLPQFAAVIPNGNQPLIKDMHGKFPCCTHGGAAGKALPKQQGSGAAQQPGSCTIFGA